MNVFTYEALLGEEPGGGQKVQTEQRGQGKGEGVAPKTVLYEGTDCWCQINALVAAQSMLWCPTVSKQYNDHIHGQLEQMQNEPPTGCCSRLNWLRVAMKEAWSGQLRVAQFVDTETNEKKVQDPSIWVCGYCRARNYEFDREIRRTKYNDIIRFYKYNGTSPLRTL